MFNLLDDLSWMLDIEMFGQADEVGLSRVLISASIRKLMTIVDGWGKCEVIGRGKRQLP
jgi:hypothetical protein